MRRFPLRSTNHENAVRNRKHTPPENSVHDGVQMRLTMGQMPVKCSQQRECDQPGRGDKEPAKRNLWRRLEEPSAADHTQQHGSQRGDEAQRQVASVVIAERAGARKQIQEPDIESLAKIRVLVPVRGEPGVEVLVPVRRHAHRGPVKSRPRRRIQRPSQPIAEENGAGCDPLPARPRKREQKSERVAEPDLRQRVFKRKVSNGPAVRAQKNPQRDQQHAAPNGVQQHAAKALTLALPAANRIRQRTPARKVNPG